ncbi:sulfate/molybdate ABC transporter ATP-binding protein [Microbacterium marinilacus]|uniref:ABC transporter domain-containing protein n=1 Tax=Microbacterium marinilacus TaxID=415209 RepID=A0ABP7BG15_9MICO|nr:ATP-binding cassette domain-containing protein [Microbacterium marinilacus]MBY0688960.1 ATP-binding cassette domain-containing protein [Microbacterium marinilacus]
MTGLELRLSVTERDVDVELTVGAGRCVAVMGPNGAGKSTILNALAGLLHPDRGRVAVDGRTLLDTDARVDVPAHRRPIAVLSQDPLLFPHLSVRENVAFPLRHRAGVGRGAAAEEADRRLDMLDAAHLADRRPSRLSGGQAQRVALARALATEPSLLLLDEPLAALDVTAVPDLRAALRRAAQGRIAIMITHDPLDALLLADELVVIERGRIAQAGAVDEALRAPRTEFGRAMLALNPWMTAVDMAALRADR